MKKLIAISLFTVWLAATSSFGQGYFIFGTAKSQAYDGFTTLGVSTLSTSVDTAFLWAPANTTPDVAAATGLASTPTSGNSSTFPIGSYYAPYQAWNAILDGQFTLAVNNDTSALVTQPTAANGTINYNGNAPFPVAGTTPNTTYTVYMISWDAYYATPALAAAAFGGTGSAVGWSTPFQYTAYTQISVLITSMTGLAANFGTFGPVPEPATLALAALGGLSLLAFRHRIK